MKKPPTMLVAPAHMAADYFLEKARLRDNNRRRP